MSLTKQQLKQIIEEEFINLVNEEEIDEKLFDKLKSFGKGLLGKTKNSLFGLPQPRAAGGVGKWYATYKEPQQPQEPEQPEKQKATTALDLVRPGFEHTPDSDIYDTEFSKTGHRYKDQSRLPTRPDSKQLNPYKKPVDPVPATRQLSSPDIQQPKMLKSPDEITTSAEHGETVTPSDTKNVVELLNKYRADLKPLNIPEREVDLVVGYLIANNRILVNPTRVPKAPESQDAEVFQEIISPSYQQGEISFDTLDNYIRNLRDFFIKEKNIQIPLIHIHAIMKSIYDDGRLAISHQKLRKMGQKFPDIKLKESKSYKSFYNNWKRYTQTGVKI
jgi:hypothetical protein